MVLVYNTICQLCREFNFMLVHVGHHMVREEREKKDIHYTYARILVHTSHRQNEKWSFRRSSSYFNATQSPRKHTHPHKYPSSYNRKSLFYFPEQERESLSFSLHPVYIYRNFTRVWSALKIFIRFYTRMLDSNEQNTALLRFHHWIKCAFKWYER